MLDLIKLIVIMFIGAMAYLGYRSIERQEKTLNEIEQYAKKIDNNLYKLTLKE